MCGEQKQDPSLQTLKSFCNLSHLHLALATCCKPVCLYNFQNDCNLFCLLSFHILSVSFHILSVSFHILSVSFHIFSVSFHILSISFHPDMDRVLLCPVLLYSHCKAINIQTLQAPRIPLTPCDPKLSPLPILP